MRRVLGKMGESEGKKTLFAASKKVFFPVVRPKAGGKTAFFWAKRQAV